MPTKPFQTNIPELIARLSGNLYNDPFIAARELLQNANDACILAEGLHGAPKGRINITIDPRKRVLEVTDTGIGMTPEDLDNFLSTIAASRKRELRKELEKKRFAEARGIAGSFGIGFLSTFIIAKEVTVRTRHLRERGPGTVWSSTGDGTYRMDSSNVNLPRGTTVSLAVKDEFQQVLDSRDLSSILVKHCPYIRTPYFINNSALPLNHEPPPWLSIDDQTVADTFLETAYHFRGLMHFYWVHDGPVEILRGRYQGRVVQTLRVNAFFAIPAQSFFVSPDPRVYTSGILVGDIGRAMPNWARFMVGGIECPDLDLTLGRDNLMDDVTFAAVRQVVRDKLTSAIVGSLADVRPRSKDKWSTAMRIHKEKILRAATEDGTQPRWHHDEEEERGKFFDSVKNLVPFRIGSEELSLGQAAESDKCLEKDGKKYLFYHSTGTRRHESAGIQEALLFDEAGMSFIDARNYYERDFLQHYATQQNLISLFPVEDGLQHILDFNVDPVDAKLIADVYDSFGVKARLSSFKPEELSGVILAVADRKAGDNEDKDLDMASPEGRSRLIELITSRSNASVYRPYTLCVNSRNRLVKELIDYSTSHGVDAHVKYTFRQLYYMAVLVFGDTNKDLIAEMTPGIANLMLSFLRRTKDQEMELSRIRELLDETEGRLQESEVALGKSVRKRTPKSIFLAYGYDNETQELVKGFKAMLEDQEVVVVDGKVDHMGSLSRQILDRINTCEMFVGILTPRETISGIEKAMPSTWVVEEKGAAVALGLPVLLIVDRTVSHQFFGNIEGDAVRLEVDTGAAAWVSAFQSAVRMIRNTISQSASAAS